MRRGLQCAAGGQGLSRSVEHGQQGVALVFQAGAAMAVPASVRMRSWRWRCPCGVRGQVGDCAHHRAPGTDAAQCRRVVMSTGPEGAAPASVSMPRWHCRCAVPPARGRLRRRPARAISSTRHCMDCSASAPGWRMRPCPIPANLAGTGSASRPTLSRDAQRRSCAMPGTGRDRAVVIAATRGSAGVVDVYVRGAVLPARVCTRAAHSRSAPHGDASASPITLAQYEGSVCSRSVSIHQPWPAINHLKSTSASRATRWSATAGATGAREGGGIDKVRVMAYRVGCGILPTTPDQAAWTTNPVPRMTAMPPQARRAGGVARRVAPK